MKIIKEKQVKSEGTESVTFRIPKHLVEKLNEVAEEHDISRQKLLAAILDQALNKDKKFTIKISD